MISKKSTKDVYSKLIKSFDRIGKEAKKDSKLLKECVEIIYYKLLCLIIFYKFLILFLCF